MQNRRGQRVEGIGRGMKGHVDRSRGIKILIVQALAEMKPTDPWRWPKETTRRIRKWSDSSRDTHFWCRCAVNSLHVKWTRSPIEYHYLFLVLNLLPDYTYTFNSGQTSSWNPKITGWGGRTKLGNPNLTTWNGQRALVGEGDVGNVHFQKWYF